MFSAETESILSRLLLKLAEDESLVEATRLNLVDQSEFNPYNVYRFLDVENKKYIDEYNLLNFLKYIQKYYLNRKHQVFATLGELRSIISHYDANEDGRLNIDEYNY